MLTKRQVDILVELCGNNGWIKGSELSGKLGISNRTVQKEIKHINEALPEGAEICSNNRLGYLLKDPARCIPVIVAENQRNLDAQREAGRTKLILILLLFEKDYITIGQIADRLYLSKSTINISMAQVKRIISRTPGMELDVSASRGIQIRADEDKKRICAMKSWDRTCDYEQLLGIWNFSRIYRYEKDLGTELSKIFVRNHYIVTGEAFEDFVKYLAISILRSELGMTEENYAGNQVLNVITREIAACVKNISGYSFNDSEIGCINDRLLELNMIRGAEERGAQWEKYISMFCENVLRQVGRRICMDEELVGALCRHLERMKLRIDSGRLNYGSHTKEIHLKYPLAGHLLKTCFCPLLDTEIPESEQGPLIYYIAAVLKTYENKVYVLLVSDDSAGSIQYIRQQLREGLNDKLKAIVCLPTYVYQRQQKEYGENADIFLTTSQELTLKYPEFVYINGFSMEEQIEKIRKRILTIQLQRKESAEQIFERCVRNDLYVSEKTEKSDILKKMEKLCPAGNLSWESVGEKIIYIISHSRERASFIQRVFFSTPVLWNHKQITKCMIIHYGLDKDIKQYFEFAQRLLEQL